MQLLDQWNDSLEPEQKTKVLRENFLTIDKAIQSTNLTLVRTVSSLVNQNINSATYAPATAFNAQFNTNGGVCIFICNFSVVTANSTGYLQLVVDTQAVMVSACGINTNGQDQVPLFYVATLPAGSHTIGVNLKSSGGNVTFFDTQANSTIYVLEYMKG